MYRPAWDVTPYEALGELRLGTPRAEVRAQLGLAFKAFRKTPAAATLTDAYNELGLHLYYGGDDRLEFIEAFLPCKPRLGDVELLGEDLEAVIRRLHQIGYQARREGDSYFVDDAGLALFAPGDSLEAVAVYRRGYYGGAGYRDI